jgi:toxin HigB-1
MTTRTTERFLVGVFNAGKSDGVAILREPYYAPRMIRSVRGVATRQFIESGKSKFSGLDDGLARRRFSALNVARKLDDLTRLRSAGLHKLRGDRAGFWAIRVNGPWRIVFRFDDGDASEVEIVDYH